MSPKAKAWMVGILIVLLIGLLIGPKKDNTGSSPSAPSHATFDDSGVSQADKDSCALTALNNGNGDSDQERGLYRICIAYVQAGQSELSSIQETN